MSFDKDLLERINLLELAGQEFLKSGASNVGERLIDTPDFHRWRVSVSKLLYASFGPSNYYYECFWKGVTKPQFDHVQEGLRLLATVKSELTAVMPAEKPSAKLDQEKLMKII